MATSAGQNWPQHLRKMEKGDETVKRCYAFNNSHGFVS